MFFTIPLNHGIKVKETVSVFVKTANGWEITRQQVAATPVSPPSFG